MDANILYIILAVVLLGVAGAAVFTIIKLRGILNTIDTKLVPALDDAKKMTSGLTTAAEQAGPLMESVNVMLDSLDVTLVELDGKLETVSNISGTVIETGTSVSKAVGSAKDSVKARLTSGK